MGILFQLYQDTNLLIIILFALTSWSLVWKGLALWKAAQKKEVRWFLAILILNTLGILPIVYLILKKEKKVLPKDTLAKVKLPEQKIIKKKNNKKTNKK